MKTLLNNLTEPQIIYVLERLRMEYLRAEVADIPTLKAKKRNLNFEAIKEMLLFLAQSSNEHQQKITAFAIESNDPSKLKQVLTMSQFGKGIRITSILLLNKLIAPIQKIQYSLSKGLSPLEKDFALQALYQTDEHLEQQIVNVLRSWDEEEKRQFLQDEIEDPISVVILTPKPVEFQAVIRLLEKPAAVFDKRLNSYYQTGYFNHLRIAVRESGAGNYQTALEVERAATFFQPKFIFLTGMAGGLSSKTSIGDIVVGNRSYYYEAGVQTDAGFMTRQRGDSYHHSLIELAKSIIHNQRDNWLRFTQHKQSYNIKIGPIAAGEKVIMTSKTEIFQLLKNSAQDALAIEMEAVGFSHALQAYEGKIKGINIRSISDMLDGKEEANLKGSKELASENAAAFVFEMLSTIQ